MKTKKKTKKEKPFKFNVLGKSNKWSAWTGMFETKELAMEWFKKYGQFHLDNDHILGLFEKNKLLNKFYP